MPLARVLAVLRQGSQPRPDVKKVLLSCELTAHGRIVESPWPGVQEEGGQRWPFVLRPGEAAWWMDFGSGYDPRSIATNIGMKALHEGELFTSGESIYEVTRRHVHVADERGVRMARVTAECTDRHRPAGSKLVFVCAVDAQGDIAEGQWHGYSEVEGEYEGCTFTPSSGELEYGTDWPDWREKTDLSSAVAGASFVVESWDEADRPDIWHYRVTECQTF